MCQFWKHSCGHLTRTECDLPKKTRDPNSPPSPVILRAAEQLNPDKALRAAEPPLRTDGRAFTPPGKYRAYYGFYFDQSRYSRVVKPNFCYGFAEGPRKADCPCYACILVDTAAQIKLEKEEEEKRRKAREEGAKRGRGSGSGRGSTARSMVDMIGTGTGGMAGFNGNGNVVQGGGSSASGHNGGSVAGMNGNGGMADINDDGGYARSSGSSASGYNISPMTGGRAYAASESGGGGYQAQNGAGDYPYYPYGGNPNGENAYGQGPHRGRSF